MQRLCGDFLLVLLSPDSQRPVVGGAAIKAGLAGAAIAAAVLDDRLVVDTDGRLRTAVPIAEVPDIWTEVLRRADGIKPKKAVARCGAGEDFADRGGRLRDATIANLLESGIIEDRTTRIIGIPIRRHAVLQPHTRDAILTRLSTALDGEPGAPQDDVLLLLLSAVGALRTLFPNRDQRALDARVTELRSAGVLADAVSQALRDLDTAVMAAVVATTVVIAGS